MFNLFVVGIVNMDEIIYGFFCKVIDWVLSFDFGVFFFNDYNDFFILISCNKCLSYFIWLNVCKLDLVYIFDVDGSKIVVFLLVVNVVLKNILFELVFCVFNELFFVVVSS